MRSYKVNLNLLDNAVFKEYRMIQRFFDMDEAELFKERFSDIRIKITHDCASAEELLECAELIKLHND